MIAAGLFTLIYAAILRFRDGWKEGSRKRIERNTPDNLT
jgi:hypothetical protein